MLPPGGRLSSGRSSQGPRSRRRQMHHAPEQIGPSRSPAGRGLSHLKINAGSLPVYQYYARIDELLTSQVEFFVASQRRQGQEEFHRICPRIMDVGRHANSRAEVNTGKIGAVLEVAQNRANEVGDMTIECQRREF